VRILAAALPAILVAIPGGARQNPAPTDLLKSASAYVVTYAPALSGTVLEEQTMLTEVVAGRMAAPPKRIASDVTFVNANAGIAALRDTYAVDTKPIRERTLRIVEALNDGSGEGPKRVQEYVRQSFHLFLANIVLIGADPMLALKILSPELQPKLEYRLDGRRTMNGVPVNALRFQEPEARDRTYVLGTPGNAHASGRFWIDPASGAIHAIDLWLESPTESASVTIQFGPDAGSKVLLPKQLSGTYDERELGAGPRSSATARTLSRRVEVVAKYSNPRHTAIK
jgi:hypothetical protein